MKIVDVASQVYRVPLSEPVLHSDTRRYDAYWHVLVRTRTSEGQEGIGYAFSPSQAMIQATQVMIEELKGAIIEGDPFSLRSLWQGMWSRSNFLGRTGPVLYALSALDIALWDTLGKVTGQPLYKLLGGAKRRVPTYASFGLWRALGLEEIGRKAAEHISRGFRAVKLRVGGEQRPEAELERVRVVREAIGKDAQLMLDVNQGWFAAQAIRMGRRLEPYDIFWMEDPVAAEDVAGSAQVAAALDIPITAGENHHTKFPFRRLLEAGAVDIVMVDLLRVGGISEWMKVAALAEVWNLPIVGHLMPEIHVHLLSALPHGLTVEYMPWSLGLFQETPQVREGFLEPPDKPGLGLELDEEALAHYEAE